MAVMSDNKTEINDTIEPDNVQLPVDVIIHILSYLSTSDRLSAGLVNQRWHEASLAMKFVEKETLVLGRPRADNLNQVINVLEHSVRPFYHFDFREVELKRNMSIWDQYGPNMKSLILYCDYSEQTLVEVFKCCKSLKALRINACRQCLILDDEKDRKELVETFKNLQELSLENNRFLSDALFNRLTAICPNLESLSLMGCQISLDRLYYKKLESENVLLPVYSNSEFTFLNILNYLTQQAEKLKHLNFGYTSIDAFFLLSVSTVINLKLESLLLQGCYQITTEAIRRLTKYQTYLKVLDVSFCVQITDVALKHICKNLTELETLRIRRCRAITDFGLPFIRWLKKLKELDISENEQLTGYFLQFSSSWPRNLDYGSNKEGTEKMSILLASALHLNEGLIERIPKFFPNLRHLELSFCVEVVTDRAIQTIFKELVHLHTLKISHCVEVSDVGLTGMNTAEKDMHDADQKPSNTFSGYSLLRLKYLRELDFSGCNKITDVSLKYAFAFPELRVLNLSQCKQITHVGLDYLSKNNTAIEDLNLNQCCNISDIGISYLAQRLHRLKRLHIQRCSQLTDRTLDSIAQHCKSLYYLDPRCCWGITLAGIERLTHLYVDGQKHWKDISSEHETLPSSAPPLPSLSSLP